MKTPHRLSASRRAVIGASASVLAAGPSRAAVQTRPDKGSAAVAEAKAILERYQSFGDKAAGGPGDEAFGAWLEGELGGLGYACARQGYDVPAYEGQAVLTAGAARAELIPQASVVPTAAGGVTAPLYVVGTGRAGPGIAILVLPYARWSSVVGVVARRVQGVLDGGASAVVIVTTGPTGEALALNAPPDKAPFDRPVAVLAPKDAEPFLKAAEAGASANLRMDGRAFRRPAFNVTARLERGASKTLMISTPRSGWFACAGERGSGMAAFVMLARWAARAPLPVDVVLVANSGHEYENLGGEHVLRDFAPPPAATALWLHLGANVAARDWHERGAILSPLPSADPQRFMLASAELLPIARAAFAGQPGLEAPYAADPAIAGGELRNVLAAGYKPAIGIFGAHRYHHARADDLRCVEPALVPPVVDGFIQIITAIVGKGA